MRKVYDDDVDESLFALSLHRTRVDNFWVILKTVKIYECNKICNKILFEIFHEICVLTRYVKEQR